MFTGFTTDDFAGFLLPTLAERMAFIKAGPRPKLEALGHDLAPFLTELVGAPIYPITAKHMRRTVNPPNDTWVALSTGKRGYKMLPHFQVGLWHTHAFIQAGVIYEAESKPTFAFNLLKNRPAVPAHFRWLEDHTQPEGVLTPDVDLDHIAARLTTKKHADCMVGLSIPAEEAVRLGTAFADTAKTVMTQLLPIYQLAR